MPEFLVEMLAQRGRHAKEILPLPDPDDDADTGGETDNHRCRDEFDDVAHARHAEQHQNDPGHQGGDLQAVDAVLGGDGGQDDDESASGSGDLDPAAAE